MGPPLVCIGPTSLGRRKGKKKLESHRKKKGEESGRYVID
jgi:hypothetical protein